MELQSVPAQEHIAACEPCVQQPARGETQHPPAMNDHGWEEEAQGALTVQCRDVVGSRPEHEAAPGDLLRRLNALHLSVPIAGYKGRRDARYPEPLSTEQSPRRRARSLPWNSIPEADVEEDDDSLMCCCKLKKKVQFADSLGLSLASVKHFMASDEPLVPQAVLARLQSYPPTVTVPIPEEMCVSECPAPAELQARLDGQRVCLEQVSASAWGVNGYILVKEPGENAQVKIRYTFNEWLSFLDCPASANQQCSAPGTERFHFNLCYPPSAPLIQFAICFITGQGQEIWDNNQGLNYTVSCQHNMLPEHQLCSPEQEEYEGARLW